VTHGKEGAPSTVSRLTDITAIFIPHLEMKNLEVLFRTIRPQITSEDIHLQKKTYKVLVSICNYHRMLVGSNFEELLKILDETEPRLNNNATKKLRLRLMLIMFQERKTLDIDTLKKLLPEIILNCKESNVGSREASFEVIKFLGEQSVQLGQDNLKILCNILSAGLALDTRFIAATWCTLGYLVKLFHKTLDTDFKRELIQTSFLFLQSPHREVIHSAIDFVQTALGVLSSDTITLCVPDLMKMLATWDQATQSKFHNNLKAVFEKLLRKLPYEDLSIHVPWISLLQSIRKTMTRTQKKKKGEKGKKDNKAKEDKKTKKHDAEVEDKYSGSLSESDNEIEMQDTKPKATDGTWIVEGKTDGEIIDFLESSASKYVVSSDPAKLNRKRKTVTSFDKSDDGRFIVEDLIEEENKRRPRNTDKTKEEEEAELAGDAPKPFIKPKTVRPKKPKTTSAHSAVRYKAKKAGGDLMKKGAKYEPYSYVPLNPKQLNKRRRFQSHKTYDNIFSVSKKGRSIQKRKHSRPNRQ